MFYDVIIIPPMNMIINTSALKNPNQKSLV